MAEVVLDASAALELVFNEIVPGLFSSERMKDVSFVAPWIWRLEVVNAVLVKMRRKLLSEAQAIGALQFLDGLKIAFATEPTSRSLERFAAFARPLQLTAYDAAYVELALSRGLPILTMDRNVRDAAKRLRIEVIE